uniref:(California timema) hypothetical protein n=1 Tax=Timema californicum TaxID=61474 RepID=A0A7R9J8F3_TIMCA|nr:unnamed protein product [Timema californicum]
MVTIDFLQGAAITSLSSGSNTPTRSDTEARSSFESPRSLPTPELLVQPDFGYITRLASQAPRKVYETRHPKETMTSQEDRNWEMRLQQLQETMDTMQARFMAITDRFGTTDPNVETPGAGVQPPSTGEHHPTLTASSMENAWASLETPCTPVLVATREQALRLALAAKAKLNELQPGRDAHELRFLLNLLADYNILPERTRQKVLHRINMVFIAVTRNWAEAVAASGDGASAAIYPPGYQPPAPIQQVIYRDRPAPRAPRGRGERRRK